MSILFNLYRDRLARKDNYELISNDDIENLYELLKHHDWSYYLREEEALFNSGFKEFIFIQSIISQHFIFEIMYDDFKEHHNKIFRVMSMMPNIPPLEDYLD